MSNILSEAVGGMNFGGLGTQIIFWIGWTLAGLLVLAGLVAVYYFLQ